MTILKVRCAWHPKYFGCEKMMGEKDGRGITGTSDGICPLCAEIERETFEVYKANKEKERIERKEMRRSFKANIISHSRGW